LVAGVGSEDGDDLPEHDPCPDFQPLIPLPDEVVPTTGEEGETVCTHFLSFSLAFIVIYFAL
jgi:hypothetical protein